ARATIDYVNSRSAVAGGRNAWWYKDEVTGFIIQGGVVNRVDYVNRVGFPRAYVRECFGVQLTLASSNGNWFGDSRVNIQGRDLDNNGFNAMMDGQEQV
ncbi:gp53-like domain-containing protein, partial [Serratia ureilytica]|uniref:gp53-like domain-containing protein n=2 Tax=Serratia TaxID=613 RepID=UPI003B637B98